MTRRAPTDETSRRDPRDRASLIGVALITTVLAGLHFADHVIRGDKVARFGLDAHWNHSGWPFRPDITPFTVSLFAVALILLGGIILTLRGRLWAGYWLAAALLLGALVTQVHLIPGPNQESFQVIYDTWVGNPVMGMLAVANTLAILAALLAMGVNAYRVGRNGRSWR